MKNLTKSIYVTPIYLVAWASFVVLTYQNFLKNLGYYNISYSLDNKYIFFPLVIAIFILPRFLNKVTVKKIVLFQITSLILFNGGLLLIIYSVDPSIFLQAPDTGTYYNLYFHLFGCKENALYECMNLYSLNHRLPSLPIVIALLSYVVKFEWVPVVFNFLVLAMWYLFPYFVYGKKQIMKAHYGTVLTSFFPLISVFGFLVLTDALFTIIFWIWFIKLARNSEVEKARLIPYVLVAIFLTLLRPEGILFVIIGTLLISLMVRSKLVILFGCILAQLIWGQVQTTDLDRYLYVNIVPKTYQYQQEIGYDEAREIANNEYKTKPYSIDTILRDQYPISVIEIIESQKKWIPANIKFSWNKQYENLPNAFFYFQYLYFAPFLILGTIGLMTLEGRQKKLGQKIALLSLCWILMSSIMGPVDITRFNLFINLPVIIGLSNFAIKLEELIPKKR